MKSFPILIIIGSIFALLFYACSPSKSSGKNAVAKLESALTQSVYADETSALAHAVKVADTYTQYFRIKCDKNEVDRLRFTLELKSSSSSKDRNPNAPSWFKYPSTGTHSYTRQAYRKADFSNEVTLWHHDGYLYLEISFWD